MAFRAAGKLIPRFGLVPTRTFKSRPNLPQPSCPSNPDNSQSKNTLCPHTPSKPVEDAANEEKPIGYLSKLAVSKKCPKVCSYMDKQCPPLVPPIVRPKAIPGENIKQPSYGLPKAPRQEDVPLAAVWGYRLVVFGVKVGIVAYFIKWTVDTGIWDKDTSKLWDRWSQVLSRAMPQQLDVMGGRSAAEHWNSGVYKTFDTVVAASNWLKRKVVQKERELYGLDQKTTPGEDKSLNIRSRLGYIGDRFTCSKDGENLDVIMLPETPEYYGIARGLGSATEEMLESLEEIGIPEFNLEQIITEQTLHEDQVKEGTEEKSGGDFKLKIVVDFQETATPKTTEPCPHQKEGVENQEKIPPCHRSDCPFFKKTDEKHTLDDSEHKGDETSAASVG